jgi:hypothetical protein
MGDVLGHVRARRSISNKEAKSHQPPLVGFFSKLVTRVGSFIFAESCVPKETVGTQPAFNVARYTRKDSVSRKGVCRLGAGSTTRTSGKAGQQVLPDYYEDEDAGHGAARFILAAGVIPRREACRDVANSAPLEPATGVYPADFAATTKT